MKASAKAFLLILLSSILGPTCPGQVPARLFNPGYLEGDCNYHSLTAASDGMLYFTVCTHHDKSSARLFRFDPTTKTITGIGDLGDILGTDTEKEIPHGKIHTPLIEHEGYLYFSTHTAYYEGSLPNMTPDDGRAPYSGGHFVRYSLGTGAFEDLVGLRLANEGIITMAMDKVRGTLYGLTWPTGLLISYNLDEGLLQSWGTVQRRGEWGPLGDGWNFICRRLAIDDAGNLYGGTDTGRIWQFNQGEQRPVRYIQGLNLLDVAPPAEEGFEILPEPHYFWNNWRTILWNPNTASFWGLQGGSTQLFEFNPEDGVLRSITSLRADDISRDTRRNPFRSQLGFMLGPDNTLVYMAHAPGTQTAGKEALPTSVHLITYAIDSGTFKDHGPLVTHSGQRIFFVESVELGPDGHLYSVAWVETSDPDRKATIQAARSEGAPAETDEVVYEMQLVQLPKWADLMD